MSTINITPQVFTRNHICFIDGKELRNANAGHPSKE